jgi:hypothetical protein
MGDGVVELVLQFGDGVRGWLGVEVLFQGFVEAVEFAGLYWPTSGLNGPAPNVIAPRLASSRQQPCIRIGWPSPSSTLDATLTADARRTRRQVPVLAAVPPADCCAPHNPW